MGISTTTLLQWFPVLRSCDPKIQKHISAEVQLKPYPANERIFFEGQECHRFILVIKGNLRVQKVANNGHEIVLYHLHPGEYCRLTNICLLGRQHFPAEAITETNVELLTMPKHAFQEALDNCPEFRDEVFASIDDALNDLVTLVQEVAFGQLDHRLAQLLLKATKTKSTLHVTHQEVAMELGTAREVVSRLLKEFERNHWLTLHRGSIEITDRHKLSEL